jgi:branched-chain amino acid transport system substrate-binding protein
MPGVGLKSRINARFEAPWWFSLLVISKLLWSTWQLKLKVKETNMKKASLWCAAIVVAALSHASQAQILIGQTAGFTGPVASGVKETTDGAKLYIDAINAKGGVGGQKIELISLDDKFDPKLAAENARKLIEEQNVVAMFLTRGTPHTEAMIPLLDKYGVPLIGPSTGAMVLHQPVKKHIFNVRATYQREAEKAVTYLSSIGISRIGIVYVDDSFGADGIASRSVR